MAKNLRASSVMSPYPSAAGPLASRRRLLGGGALAVGLTAIGAAAHAAGESKPPDGKGNKGTGDDQDIGPGEDLMREHGVLRRVLLVYAEAGRRLETPAGELDPAAIQRSAKVIRAFIEDYHERQEEELVFPLFEHAHKLLDLVRVLRAQHQSGRRVTERVQALATANGLKDPGQRRELRAGLLSFTRMYEPHAAREDTVLFPALHEFMSPSAYDALGEDFERREHKIFGQNGFGGGFEHAVAEIDAIEKLLGIEDLSSFTPKG